MRCKLVLSFDADAPGEAGRFARAVLAVSAQGQFPGITNQGHDFQRAVMEWKPTRLPAINADPNNGWLDV